MKFSLEMLRCEVSAKITLMVGHLFAVYSD